MSRMPGPFQNMVREYIRIHRQKGWMKALWFIRDYDYKRCRIRRKKAVITERNRCERFMDHKVFMNNKEARIFLFGAKMALDWCLNVKTDSSVVPGMYAWKNFEKEAE